MFNGFVKRSSVVPSNAPGSSSSSSSSLHNSLYGDISDANRIGRELSENQRKNVLANGHEAPFEMFLAKPTIKASDKSIDVHVGPTDNHVIPFVPVPIYPVYPVYELELSDNIKMTETFITRPQSRSKRKIASAVQEDLFIEDFN